MLRQASAEQMVAELVKRTEWSLSGDKSYDLSDSLVGLGSKEVEALNKGNGNLPP